MLKTHNIGRASPDSHQSVSDDKYQMLWRKMNYTDNLHVNYGVMARQGLEGKWDFILNLAMASASAPKGEQFWVAVGSFIYVCSLFFFSSWGNCISSFLFPFSSWKFSCCIWFVEIRTAMGSCLSLLCGEKGLESLLSQGKSLVNSRVWLCWKLRKLSRFKTTPLFRAPLTYSSSWSNPLPPRSLSCSLSPFPKYFLNLQSVL